jgi:hypothetical protein
MKQTLSRSERQSASRAPSLEVDRLPARTVAPWGITGPELERLSSTVRFMELHCRPRTRTTGLWLATTARDTPRSLIADVWKRITRQQGKFGLRPYSVLTFETRGGIHAHIAYIGNPEIASRLKASKKFADLVDVRPIPEPNGLTRKYLAKERTPQAGYRRAHMLGGRQAGSHRLPGGGDRVRLSRQLERDAIEAGYIEPWQRTYARRSVARKSAPAAQIATNHVPTSRGVRMNAPVRPPGPFLRPSKSGHCFGSDELVWDALQLRLASGGRVLATVEPDGNWSGMWRVRSGGTLSDMANLSRAKDAALSIVLRELNAGRYQNVARTDCPPGYRGPGN